MSLTPQVVTGAPDGAPAQGRNVTMKSYLSPRDLADKVQVSNPTAHIWLRRHPGLGAKVGGRWRIRPEVADAILAGTPLVEAANLGRAGR